MDGKNVLMAIILSSIVLVVWAVLFEPVQITKKKLRKSDYQK